MKAKTLKFNCFYDKIILPKIKGKFPKEEKSMKNLIRILIALVLAVSCVFACTSCAVFDGLKDIFGGNQDDANDDDNDSSGENNDDNKPKPPSGNIDTSDGGYVLFATSGTSREELKAFFDTSAHTPECVNTYGSLCEAIYLLNNDFAVVIIMSIADAPTEILNEIDT